MAGWQEVDEGKIARWPHEAILPCSRAGFRASKSWLEPTGCKSSSTPLLDSKHPAAPVLATRCIACMHVVSLKWLWQPAEQRRCFTMCSACSVVTGAVEEGRRPRGQFKHLHSRPITDESDGEEFQDASEMLPDPAPSVRVV